MKHDIKNLNKVVELLFGKTYDDFTKIEKNNYRDILFLIDRYYDFFFLCLERETKFPPFSLEKEEGSIYPVYTYKDQTCKIQNTDNGLVFHFFYEKDHIHFMDTYSIFEREKHIVYRQYNFIGDIIKETKIDDFNDGLIRVCRDCATEIYSCGSFNKSISYLESEILNLEYHDFLTKKKVKKLDGIK